MRLDSDEGSSPATRLQQTQPPAQADPGMFYRDPKEMEKESIPAVSGETWACCDGFCNL